MNATPRALRRPRLNARRQHHRLSRFLRARVKKEAMIDDDGEKQSAVYIAVLGGQLFVFLCNLDSPRCVTLYFFPHRPLFLSREEKRTKRFETSERAS